MKKYTEDELQFLFKIYSKTFYQPKGKFKDMLSLKKKCKNINNNLNRDFIVSLAQKIIMHNTEEDGYEEVKKCVDKKILDLCRNDLDLFKGGFPDVKLESILDENKEYSIFRNHNLVYYYVERFIPLTIKNNIEKLLNTEPEKDYPTAREMKRKFIIHVGPTNSGKTYQSLERLKECEKGIYLGPLRLLALEVYDKFNEANVPCNMITGEEELIVDDAVCQASTIEMLNTDDYFDIAVIDEVQMIADPFRGYNWTKAILGLCANEIHLCMANQSLEIVKTLIEICKDEYEIHYHERMTPLVFEEFKDKEDDFVNNLEKGDAIIAFSKKMVLSIAMELKEKGVNASIIYGNLPPSARKKQVERFVKGETDVVVSTDAIGMGLNLPIKRVVFFEIEKFDGYIKRFLTPQEIKQIAGRAGRRGIYEKGYVTTLVEDEYVKNALTSVDKIIKKVPLGFPEILLDIPYDINHILQTWADIKTKDIFIKMNPDDLLTLYSHYTNISGIKKENHTKKEIYNFLTCPVSLKDDIVINDWKQYCKEYAHVEEYNFPTFYGDFTNLDDLETYYRQLDLYFQFSRKTKKEINREKLYEEKEKTVEKINKILQDNISSLKKKCISCGKPMPLNSTYARCFSCFKKHRKYYHPY